MVYLVVMKIATRYKWKTISENSRRLFGSRATAKDCESKFNKDLKRSKITKVVKQWLEYGDIPEDDVEGVGFLLDAIVLLGEVPFGDRRA